MRRGSIATPAHPLKGPAQGAVIPCGREIRSAAPLFLTDTESRVLINLPRNRTKICPRTGRAGLRLSPSLQQGPAAVETAATVADLLREARDCLAAAGDGDGGGDGGGGDGDGAGDGDGDDAIDARVDAEVLLSHATGLPVATQVADAGRRVPAAPAAAFRALVARRAAGEPVAYLTGRKAFWSLELTVTPAVLIPRPETELLVEAALAFAAGRRGSRRFRALELGTGSGAVALALARELPDAAITATDSSAAALQVARVNYRRLRTAAGDSARAAAGAAARSAAGDSVRPAAGDSAWAAAGVATQTAAGAATRPTAGDSAPPGLGAVEFRLGDWFNALPASSRFDPPSRSRFDLIVCNPPYIAPGDPHLQRGDLRFEPRAALVSPPDGLADLEKIIASAPPHLNPGGMLLLEHAHTQSAAVRELFSRHHFTVITTHPDLAGHARATSGT